MITRKKKPVNLSFISLLVRNACHLAVLAWFNEIVEVQNGQDIATDFVFRAADFGQTFERLGWSKDDRIIVRIERHERI